MTEARDDVFDDLSEAILDGAAVNWAAIESTAGELDRGLFDQLRLLAAVVEVHGRAPAEEAALSSGSRWGNLRILERIGRGAFGEVYRSWDEKLDREVALKILPARETSEGDDAAILEEGRALARSAIPTWSPSTARR